MLKINCILYFLGRNYLRVRQTAPRLPAPYLGLPDSRDGLSRGGCPRLYIHTHISWATLQGDRHYILISKKANVVSIYRQSLIFSSTTKKPLLANFHANIDIFIIHGQSVTISVTVFSILTKNDLLSYYLLYLTAHLYAKQVRLAESINSAY